MAYGQDRGSSWFFESVDQYPEEKRTFRNTSEEIPREPQHALAENASEKIYSKSRKWVRETSLTTNQLTTDFYIESLVQTIFSTPFSLFLSFFLHSFYLSLSLLLPSLIPLFVLFSFILLTLVTFSHSTPFPTFHFHLYNRPFLDLSSKPHYSERKEKVARFHRSPCLIIARIFS